MTSGREENSAYHREMLFETAAKKEYKLYLIHQCNQHAERAKRLHFSWHNSCDQEKFKYEIELNRNQAVFEFCKRTLKDRHNHTWRPKNENTKS